MDPSLINLLESQKKAMAAQSELVLIKQKLQHVIVTHQTADGKVKVTVNCVGTLKSLEIDPSLRDQDIKVLQDLVLIAVNAGLQKAAAHGQIEIAKVTDSLDLPPEFRDLL